jgi:hypothetical protein
MQYIRIQLIHKYADRINGVDLASYTVGDVLDLPEPSGAILIDAGWALPVQPALPAKASTLVPSRDA